MRAINHLKASACRGYNNGASNIDTGLPKSTLNRSIDREQRHLREAGAVQIEEYKMNRSTSSSVFFGGKSSNLAQIDRSAILSSAQSYFQSKTSQLKESQSNNRMQLVEGSFLSESSN